MIGTDYTLNTQATYPPCIGASCNGTSQCIDIEIIEDEDVEGTHNFEIQISGVNIGTVSPGESSTVFNIVDNTGVSAC